MITEGKKSFIFNTDIGNMVVEVTTARKYNIEDLVRDRALSLMLTLQMIIKGKQASANSPSASRTVPSRFFQTTEEI